MDDLLSKDRFGPNCTEMGQWLIFSNACVYCGLISATRAKMAADNPAHVSAVLLHVRLLKMADMCRECMVIRALQSGSAVPCS